MIQLQVITDILQTLFGYVQLVVIKKYFIGASVSEPPSSDANGNFLYIYILAECVALWGEPEQAVHGTKERRAACSKQWHEGEKSNNVVGYCYDLCNPRRRRMCT